MIGRMAGPAAAVMAAAGTTGAAAYRRAMRRAYDRIESRGRLIDSPYGRIEFTTRGEGPPVLVIHGSGGGYDQGELVAAAAVGDGFRCITPSRFGYLGSACPERATFDGQADAYACLLDHLGIERVAVVALSHGGPSALLFALLHPERVSSLTLVSCGVAGASGEDQAGADHKGDVLVRVFRRDWVYWGISRFFKPALVRLMGADPSLVGELSRDGRQTVDRVIEYMNPVAPRAAGVAFDNAAAMPDGRIAGIQAPTLILHARDDGLQLYRNAEFAASAIPGAQLMAFDRGGHLLLGVEQEAILHATRRHILEHSEMAERGGAVDGSSALVT